METKSIIIARSYSLEQFYSKKFKSKEESIRYGQQVVFQERGCVITYLREKRSGHRWDVDVTEQLKYGMNISTIVVNSKKNAILAAKSLKEYDDTLKISITKIY